MFIYNIFCPYIYYIVAHLFSSNLEIKRKLFFVLIGIHLFIYWSFFNYQTFPDVPHYNNYYLFLTKHSIDDFYAFSPFVNTEYGYLLFNKILTYISDNPRLLYIGRSFIQVFCLLYIVKKYSLNYFLSINMFILTFGVGQSLFVVRQYLALLIFLLSIDYIIQKKIIKFGIIFLVAFSIHKSIIVFIPLYFLYNFIDLGKVSIKKILLVSLLIILFAKPLFYILFSKLGLYVSYLENDTTEGLASAGMFFRCLLFYLPFLFFSRFSLLDNKYLKLYFWGGLLSLIISVLIIGIPSGSRLFTNYNALNFIFFPLICSTIENCRVRNLYISCIVLLFTYLSLTGGDSYSYYFMWENCPEFL